MLKSALGCSIRGKIAQFSRKINQKWPKVAQFPVEVAQKWPDVAQLRPKVAQKNKHQMPINISICDNLILRIKSERSITMDNNQTPHESDLPWMSKPANRELLNAGYSKLEQFTEVTEAEILEIHGVGPKAIRMLNEALQERGLSFKKDK